MLSHLVVIKKRNGRIPTLSMCGINPTSTFPGATQLELTECFCEYHRALGKVATSHYEIAKQLIISSTNLYLEIHTQKNDSS